MTLMGTNCVGWMAMNVMKECGDSRSKDRWFVVLVLGTMLAAYVLCTILSVSVTSRQGVRRYSANGI